MQALATLWNIGLSAMYSRIDTLRFHVAIFLRSFIIERRTAIRAFVASQRGDIAKSALAVLLGIILLAALGPVAFDMFFGADTEGWDSNTVVIWGLIPILALLGIALHFWSQRSK